MENNSHILLSVGQSKTQTANLLRLLLPYITSWSYSSKCVLLNYILLLEMWCNSWFGNTSPAKRWWQIINWKIKHQSLILNGNGTFIFWRILFPFIRLFQLGSPSRITQLKLLTLNVMLVQCRTYKVGELWCWKKWSVAKNVQTLIP